jgi:hypothetical protein
VPKRDILELATLKVIEACDGALLIERPGTGKRDIAKSIVQLYRPSGTCSAHAAKAKASAGVFMRSD